MEYKERKRTRLSDYNYSTPGAYFVTVCTRDRKELLSKITVGDGVLDVPQNILTQHGKIAEKYINQMNEFYDSVSVDKYVIMPNHIHLILSITNPEKSSDYGTSRTPSPTNAIVANFISAFKRFCDREYGENIWQRGYHDHIIRGREDYDAVWEYIDTNVLKWQLDRYYDSRGHSRMPSNME